MVPTHALRFQSMLRSMTEVVLPALDPSQRLAIDQVHILIGNLRILLDQAGRAEDYDRTELEEFKTLGAGLLELVGVEGEAHRALIVKAAAKTGAELSAQTVETKFAADALLKIALASKDKNVQRAASLLVLEQAHKQATRERVWVRSAGFELDPAALPSIDAVLA